jgi:hypothetical protein
MPIYEYYCPDNNRIYQFYARTLAQGAGVPPCPDNSSFRMQKVLSGFAVGGGARRDDAQESAALRDGGAGDARMNAAMGAMEREFAGVDENDPRAMGRMMRRMAEITGEKMEGNMEEVVRRLEEGAHPESLEEELGADDPPAEQAPEARPRRARREAPTRDPKLYDYP